MLSESWGERAGHGLFEFLLIILVENLGKYDQTSKVM